MKGAVTLTDQDQLRVRALNRVLEGSLTGAEAADQLGLSVRQLRRLVARYRAEGAAAIPPPTATGAARPPTRPARRCGTGWRS